MEFQEELRTFFLLKLHTPDSNLVRNGLEELWRKHLKKSSIDLTKDWGGIRNVGDSGNPVPPPSIKLLKYLSRRHGLPSVVVKSLVAFLDSSIPKSLNFLEIKWIISQTIKYALNQDPNLQDFQQILNSLKQLDSTSASIDFGGRSEILFKEILSQLLQCLVIKITPDNWDETILVGTLRTHLPSCNQRTQSLIHQKLVKIGVTLDLGHHHHKGKGQDHIQSRKKIDVEADLSNQSEELAIFSVGTDILGHVKKVTTKPAGQGGSGADAVKTQAAVTSVVKQNVSERSEIESINLSKALSTSRAKATTQNTEVNPTVDNSGDSVRWWYRTTAGEVENFYTMAKSGQTICNEDIYYLRDSFIGWKFGLQSATITVHRIAQIFAMISKTHRIPDGVLDSLCCYGFEKSSSVTNVLEQWAGESSYVWEHIRIKLLKAFVECSKQVKGHLPAETTRVLTNFRKMPECNSDMKKQIWIIFRKDDNNLEKNFQMAIDDLVNPIETPSVQEKPNIPRYQLQALNKVLDIENDAGAPENSEVQAIRALEDKIEYIHEQIVVEERARDLEIKQSFLQKLVAIVLDPDDKPRSIRAKVAAMISDILDHGWSLPLPSQTLRKFVENFQESEKNWSECPKDRNLFQSSLVNCVLKSLNKDAFQPEDSTIQSEVLQFLVEVATRDRNRKLEALVLVTLGNLSVRFIENPLLRIPDAQNLAGKLTRLDTVDSDGNVMIQGQDKDEKSKTKKDGSEISDEVLPGVTFISALTANMLLRSVKLRNNANYPGEPFTRSTCDLFVSTLTLSPDKMTRILCSECLWETALGEGLPAGVILNLRPFADESKEKVPDIYIQCRAAICQTLDKMMDKNPNEANLTTGDLVWLTGLYATEKLLLGEKDFTGWVNPPILKTIRAQAEIVQFPDPVYQILTFVLTSKQEDASALIPVILETILLQVNWTFQKLGPNAPVLPTYCQQAIEANFLSGSLVLPSLRILQVISSKLGQGVSDPVLEELYKFLQDNVSDSEEQALGFDILLSSSWTQDLTDRLFNAVDIEFAGRRLLTHLQLQNELSDSNLHEETMKTFTEFVPKQMEKGVWVSGLLRTIQNYVEKGLKLSPMNLYCLEMSLQPNLVVQTETARILECLLMVAENGQLLSAEIVDLAFNSDSEILPSLALALVQNNQNLPPQFVVSIVAQFCRSDWNWIFSSGKIPVKILSILTRLVQNNQKFAEIRQVMDKFCEGWVFEKGGSHRQRLEILSALASAVNHGREINLEGSELKRVFLDALRGENEQMLETGLHGFIALNKIQSDSGKFCTDEDYTLLLQIQRRPGTSSSIKNAIIDFLSRQKKELPRGLQAQINLSNLDGKSDTEFLQDLQMLIHLKDWDFFLSPQCQQRFSKILETKSNGTETKTVLIPALEIIDKYPKKVNLPLSTLEGVAFAMVNHNTNDKETTKDIQQEICRRILEESLEEGVKFTKTVVGYLQMDIESPRSAAILLKIPKESGLISDNLRVTLHLQYILLDKKSLDSKALKEMGDHLAAVQMNPGNFRMLLELLSSSALKSPPPPLVQLISRTLLRFSNVYFDSEIVTKVGQILEKSLVEGQLSETESFIVILEAFVQITNRGYEGDTLYTCLKSLTKLYNSKKCDLARKVAILKVFIAAFQIPRKTSSLQFVPYSTVELLLDAVQGTLAPLRTLSMRAMNVLRSDSIQTKTAGNKKNILGKLGSWINKDKEKPEENDLENIKRLEQDFVDYLGELGVKVFQEIYQNHPAEIVERERMRDPEFTTDLLIFLQSLTYWDFKSLRKEMKIADRSQWPIILLNSDFLSTFSGSKSEELELQELLQELNMLITTEDSLTSEEKEIEKFRFLQELMEKFRDVPKGSVRSIMQNLCQLSYTQVLTILQDPQFSSNLSSDWKISTQKFLLNERVQQKFSFKLSTSILQMLSQNFIEATGHGLAEAIVRIITTIPDVHSFEQLTQLLEKNSKDLDRLSRILKHSLSSCPPASLSPAEILILLEINLLMEIHIPQDFPRKLRLQRILKSLLSNGVNFEDILELVQLTLIKRKENLERKKGKVLHKAFEHVTFQASQYGLGAIFFERLVRSLRSLKSPEEFIAISNRFVGEEIFEGKTGVKDIEQVVNEFRLNNSRTSYKWSCLRDRFVQTGYQWDFLKLKMIQINDGDLPSQLYEPILDGIVRKTRNICQWNASEIENWAKTVKDKFKSLKEKAGKDSDKKTKWQLEELNENEFYLEALTIARRAIKLKRNFDLTQVQILSLILALQKLEKDKHKGQLQQVATGSGKSAIIAVLSVIKAVQGDFVDVYTSSAVLAERDSKEWSKFYEMFGLTCSHNGDGSLNYISGVKKCYRSNIVYGDCSQFQFDYLRDKYSDLHTLAGRTCDYAIVDEVDSMLLDDASKLARLSSSLPGMDLLEILYHFLWDRLLFLKEHLFRIADKFYYLEGKTTVGASGNVAYHFADAQTQEMRTIPNIFHYILCDADLEIARIRPVETIEVFVVSHLTDYVRSLITASPDDPKRPRINLPMYLQDFAEGQIPKWVDSALTALTYQENVHYVIEDGQIKPVDFRTTGVVQSSTNWNNGLHQLLGIKHSLRIQPETITTNFLSNAAMLGKYGPNILGFTGTLGSKASREVLYNVYKVKLLVLPETNFKRYLQFPDIMSPSETEWLKEIVISALEESSKGRGVLVICETIAKADEVSSALSQFKVRVKVYTKNEDEGRAEKTIEKIYPGDIIVATNLAGRGTDIKTTDVEDNGGLHVILTFLPESQRIEEQAFGRTSRQGNKGTGQLIILQGETEVSSTESTVTHKSERDEREKTLLENFQNVDFAVIQTKDVLFEKFRQFLKKTRDSVKSERSDWKKEVEAFKADVNKMTDCIGGVSTFREDTLTPYESIVLQSLEERWAMFMRKVDDGLIPLEKAVESYEAFQNSVQKDLDEGSLCLLTAGRNLFNFIQLGNTDFKTGDLDKALGYFETATKMDPSFAAGAIYGKAVVLLKRKEMKQEDKETALELFKSSLPPLYDEMALLTTMQTLVERALEDKSNIDTPLFRQLTEKANLLGNFIKNVQMNMDTIERGLRRTWCEGHKSEGHLMESNLIPDSVINSSKRNVTPREMDEYKLTFNDLTCRSDADTIDQAVDTINLRGTNMFTSRIAAVGDARKWWKSVKFKVNLWCPSGDLKKLLEVTETNVLEQKLELGIQLLGLGVDPGGTIDFPLDDIKGLASSYTLEVLTTAEDLEKIALDLNLPGKATVSLHSQQKGSSSNPNTFIQHLSAKQSERNRQVDSSKVNQLTSIEFKDIKTKEELVQLIQKLKSHSRSPPNINLTLYGLEKNDKAVLLNCWNKTLSNYNNNNLLLTNMDDRTAEKIIPVLRNLQMRFQLQVTGLNLKSAQSLLEHASLEQEKFEQSKMEELTELYMKNSLPLREIQELQSRGLCILVTFNEMQFIPWLSITGVCALASVQIIVGGLLICTGFGASLGLGLITEGMSDLVTAHRAYTSRQFSWTDYATQKSVSLLITAVSLGTSGIKDGAKGLGMLGKGALQQGAGQATTAGFTEVIKHTGKNLSSLAVKQIAVSGAQTTARVALKTLTDNLANFCFDQLRESIRDEVSSKVSHNFRTGELGVALRTHWVLEKSGNSKEPTNRLNGKVQNVVQNTFNPKSDFWRSKWDSVGSPLVTGILSDPKFVGSAFNTAALCWGALSGIKELATIIDKVCTQILTELDDETNVKSIDWGSVLQVHCGLSKMQADMMSTKIKLIEYMEKDGESQFFLQVDKLEDYSKKDFPDMDKQAYQKVNKFLQNMSKTEKNFKFSDCFDLSMTTRSVVELVTSHIIKIANSHLVSPAMSKFGGSLVASISSQLQDRFLVSESEMTPEQLENRKNVQNLKDKEEAGGVLTPDEKSWLEQNDRPVTFQSQIMGNAKDYTIAYQRRELAILTSDQGSSEGTSSSSKVSDNVKSLANEVNGKGAATLDTITEAGRLIGEKIKVVDDPNYVPTDEDKAENVKIVLYEPPPPGDPSAVGHFRLQDPSGKGFVDIQSNDQDCGYAIISHLTKEAGQFKTTEEIRADTAKSILSDSERFDKVLDIHKWVDDRYPEEANKFLFKGGREYAWRASSIRGQYEAKEKQKEEEKQAELKRINETGVYTFDSKKEEVEEILNKEREDEPGYIYSYKEVGVENGPIKIGFTTRTPEERMREAGKTNDKDYEMIHSVPVPLCRTAEKVALAIMEDKVPKETMKEIGVKDGCTEYVWSPKGKVMAGLEYTKKTIDEHFRNNYI